MAGQGPPPDAAPLSAASSAPALSSTMEPSSQTSMASGASGVASGLMSTGGGMQQQQSSSGPPQVSPSSAAIPNTSLQNPQMQQQSGTNQSGQSGAQAHSVNLQTYQQSLQSQQSNAQPGSQSQISGENPGAQGTGQSIASVQQAASQQTQQPAPLACCSHLLNQQLSPAGALSAGSGGVQSPASNTTPQQQQGTQQRQQQSTQPAGQASQQKPQAPASSQSRAEQLHSSTRPSPYSPSQPSGGSQYGHHLQQQSGLAESTLDTGGGAAQGSGQAFPSTFPHAQCFGGLPSQTLQQALQAKHKQAQAQSAQFQSGATPSGPGLPAMAMMGSSGLSASSGLALQLARAPGSLTAQQQSARLQQQQPSPQEQHQQQQANLTSPSVSKRPRSLEESPLRMDEYEPAFPSTLPKATRFSLEAEERRRLSFGESSHAPAPLPSLSLPDPALRRRHATDFAPFNLWNEAKQNFDSPSEDQRQWIFAQFPECDRLAEVQPFFVLRCPTPPKLNCYTIGGRPTLFRKSLHDPSDEPLYRCMIGNPKVQVDDIPKDLLRMSLHPTEVQISLIMSAVDFKVSRVYFYAGTLVFEVIGDIVSRQLPGRIGGLPCFYVGASTGLFRREEKSDRVVTPSPGVSDDTWYQPLRPGVRVTSGDGCSSTSLGVLLRNSEGDRFLTVANHGFKSSNVVGHPILQTKVGDIVHRVEESDIALVRMELGVQFLPNDYFSIVPPRRLIPKEELRVYDFVTSDGYSSGGRTFFVMGFEYVSLPDVFGEHIKMSLYQEASSVLFSMSTAGDDNLVGGICGAPVVKEADPSIEGFIPGMIGSFRFSDGHFSFVPKINPLLDRGFEVFFATETIG